MRQFNVNRRMLSIILCIVLICTFTLSIAYAALSTVLTINGNAEVVASNWNIHLDNPRVSSGSVTKTLPVISGSTMTFSSSLVDPGDYYEFTVDVVNDGSIDAMIDSVSVTPTLTDSQKKYLRYEVTYQNGESISSKQTLRKGSSMPIKVRVEFRSDIPVSDLPSTATSLNHKVTLVYSQSDGTGSSVKDNGVQLIKIVSGDGTNKSDEVCIGEECFYVMYSDETTVTMLAKYNLYVGREYNSGWTAYGDEATGKQDSTMLGYVSGQSIKKGTTMFSNTNYWSTVISYPIYVYASNSTLYSYVENYKTYLSTLGVTPSEARLITYEELISLGCSGQSCSTAPSWVYATSYWSGSAGNIEAVWSVLSDGRFGRGYYSFSENFGCRPVITIPKWQFANEIEFTVDGRGYTAKEGMTWAEWVDSEFDSTDRFGIDGKYIGHLRIEDTDEFYEAVAYNDSTDDVWNHVGINDTIIAGYTYISG